MAPPTLQSAPLQTSDEMHLPELSPASSSSNAHLTPDSDSDDSELDMVDGRESFKLQYKRTKDAEKAAETIEDDSDEGEEEYHDSARRRTSVSTTQSYQLYTPDEERAVVRKFDRKLVLFVALLYMLSFLDRSNIGNARIAGLDIDLDLDSSRYEWVITAFYIAYICFEWMSILWKIIPAHIYITVIVLSWGTVASLQSVATSFTGLLILRVLLGIGEAGFTGIPFYLSFFFKREELALRTGFFISAAPFATSFASILAWAIIKLGKSSPIASWRLLMLVEGFPSIIVAIMAWSVIPDSPGTASYLTKREKKVARLRLRKQKDASDNGYYFNLHEMFETIKDPKTYLTAIMFFCTNMAFSSMPVFLPTIVHEMGHSVLVSQALCAPAFLAAFLIVILTAYLSDRLQSRAYFICFHALMSASGYAFNAFAGSRGWSPWWRYASLYPAASGFFSVITIIITWTINNQESESKQGTGFAVLQLIGQCGPLLGTRIYPGIDAPLYTRGMSICAAAMVLVALLALILRFYLSSKNKASEMEYGKIPDEDHTLVHSGRPSKMTFKFML